MSHKQMEQIQNYKGTIPTDSIMQKLYLQATIKEKDLNRILFDQDVNNNAEERIQHIQESVKRLPHNLLRNYLHLPINIIQTHKKKENKVKSVSKPRPILTENMLQSMNKIRNALTPINGRNMIIPQRNNILNSSFDAKQERTTTNITTNECRRKKSDIDYDDYHKITNQQNYSKIPHQSKEEHNKKIMNRSFNIQNKQIEQFKNNYDISSQPATSKNSKAMAQNSFKFAFQNNDLSYTTRASTARTNTFRMQSCDNKRQTNELQYSLRQQLQNDQMIKRKQNSLSINNSIEFISLSNEKQTLQNSNQVLNGLSQTMTPFSIDTINIPLISQTYAVPFSNISNKPKTNMKIQQPLYQEIALDNQIDFKISSRASILDQIVDEQNPSTENEDNQNITIEDDTTLINEIQIPKEYNFKKRNAIIDMRKVNKNVEYLNQYTTEFLPSWIRKRTDFIKVFLQSQISKKLIIPKICLKPQQINLNQQHFITSDRYLTELDTLEEYLRKIRQLKDVCYDLMKAICQHLKVQIIWEGEKMISVGEDVSCMFVVYEGELTQQKNGSIMKTLKDDELQFRNALIKETKSEYDYIATSQCIILYLERKDYKEIINKYQEKVLNNFKVDIKFLTLFKDFPKETLTTICNSLKGRLYLVDEVVYEFQDSPQNFYIIYEGEIKCETVFYMLNQNCWPKKHFEKEVDHDYHEYRTFSKTLKNEKILEKGEFFGDHEVIYNVGRMASTIAHKSCFLLCMTKQQFYSIFTYKEINKFIQYRYNFPIKLENNLKSIQKEQKNKDTVTTSFSKYITNLQCIYIKQRKRIMSSLNVLLESAPPKDKVEKIEQKIQAYKKYIDNKDFSEVEEKQK